MGGVELHRAELLNRAAGVGDGLPNAGEATRRKVLSCATTSQRVVWAVEKTPASQVLSTGNSISASAYFCYEVAPCRCREVQQPASGLGVAYNYVAGIVRCGDFETVLTARAVTGLLERSVSMRSAHVERHL